MKIVQALQWVIAHQDLVFMFLGEFFAVCIGLLAAVRPLIKLFAKVADVTANTWDNAVVNALSDSCDAIAATLDRLRRMLPVHFGPPIAAQPITTKETRLAASMRPPDPAPPIPPLESKSPPPIVTTLTPAPISMLDEDTLQRDTIPEEPKP